VLAVAGTLIFVPQSYFPFSEVKNFAALLIVTLMFILLLTVEWIYSK